MSRSFKKQPFMAICGNGSAKQDKTIAHRGERRAQRAAICKAVIEDDFENFLLPHRLECSGNEVYSWGRDGNQLYQGLDAKDWVGHHEAIFGGTHGWLGLSCYQNSDYEVWPPMWYQRMMRK